MGGKESIECMYNNSVQLRYVTSKMLTAFITDCELILEILEHAVLFSLYSYESSIQVLSP